MSETSADWTQNRLSPQAIHISETGAITRVAGDWSRWVSCGMLTATPAVGRHAEQILGPGLSQAIRSAARSSHTEGSLHEFTRQDQDGSRWTLLMIAEHDGGCRLLAREHTPQGGSVPYHILRAIVEHSPVTIEVTDPDGTLEYVNPHFERVTGYQAAEVLGSRAGVESSGATPPDTYRELWTRVKNGQTWTGSFVNQTRDGRRYVEDGIITPITGPDGRLERIVAIQVDRTREHEAQEALSRSEQLFRALFDFNRDALYIHQSDGTIREANEAAVRLTGYAHDELVGRSMRSIDLKYDETVLDLFVDRDDTAPLVVVAEHTRKDGSRVPVEVRVSPIDRDGEQLFIAAAHDVSQRIAHEQRLQTALEEKETLLREVHHRVKNNLQSVESLLFLQSSQRAELAEGPAAEVLQQVSSRIHAIAEVHNLLYRSDELAAVNLVTLLREIVLNTLPATTNRGQAIRSDVSGPEIVLALDDAIPVALVVNELLLNAGKHAWTQHTDPANPPTIMVSIAGTNDAFQVTVEDNGCGCDSFSEESSGLGHVLVRSLVSQLKARMEIGPGPAGSSLTLGSGPTPGPAPGPGSSPAPDHGSGSGCRITLICGALSDTSARPDSF